MAKIEAYQVYRIVFIVIGFLVAAALVIGVIYLLQRRGDQVRHDKASQIAEQQVKQQQKSTNTPVPPSNTNSNPSSTPNQTTSTNPSSDTTPPTSGTTPSPAELPVTGTGDTIMPIIVIALLSFTTASYFVSRRAKAL